MNTAVAEIQRMTKNSMERRVMEEPLMDSESLCGGILDHLPDATFAVNTDGKVILWNRAMEQLTGVPASEMVGKGNYEYSLPFYGDRMPILIDLVFRDNEETRKRYPFLARENGTLIAETDGIRPIRNQKVLWGKASPLFDRGGRLIGAIETLRDITGRKHLEDDLRQINERLKLANTLARHDLLNQLTALKGYLDISGEYMTDPKKLAIFVEKEKQISAKIIDQVRLMRESQDLVGSFPGWQDLRGCICQALAMMQGNDARVNVDCVNVEVLADPLLYKVFYNLLENSVNHGGRDGVKKIGFSSSESEEGLVVVYEDDGVGIPVEEKKRIFEKGFGKHTGLGLFLIRNILSITGISIRETGSEGKGARFEIVVPHGSYRING